MNPATFTALNASTATGVPVGITFEVTPDSFLQIVRRIDDALVVHVDRKGKGNKHFYLVAYGGYQLVTSANKAMTLPSSVEMIEATSVIQDIKSHVNGMWQRA